MQRTWQMPATPSRSERDTRYVAATTRDSQGSPNLVKTPSSIPLAVQTELKELPAQAMARIEPRTAVTNPNYVLAAMANAADAGDERAYLAAYRLMDWERCDAATFETAIHLAFAAGAHMAARLLATKGAALHPDSPYLQKADYILAPPKVIRRGLPAEQGPVANRAWMVANRTAYRGQWVALRNGELLANAGRLQELTERFGADPSILFTRVT